MSVRTILAACILTVPLAGTALAGSDPVPAPAAATQQSTPATVSTPQSTPAPDADAESYDYKGSGGCPWGHQKSEKTAATS